MIRKLIDLCGPHEGDAAGNILVPAAEWGYVQQLLAGKEDVFVVLGKADFEGDTLLAIELDQAVAESLADQYRHPPPDEVRYDEVVVTPWRLGNENSNSTT